ncbi:MAG: patatin-like phospholipase family protein [Bacteroidia bacterium]|mgnify:FL=1|nr:patatin-like phospholipase family protein [Bacteroidia bacterium]HMU78097.1 patatin-like phospholipase family protein [Bacteroidia bacterium]HMW11166.1 patatin-like phospholipase family protein [Bacteroidia bacterium]HMX97958.1 patatin-like phospholipase family protein [Bacteroidia bacterium]HMY14539.1 patatin-like phospholipase family protein [Bacteroidia bacterium]
MNSKEIKYLTFEGGGGKCIAYLGAIKALEEKKILPLSHVNTVNFKTDDLDINIPQNNLFGVSGSSGGALIAFFLSMGLDLHEMESLFNEPYDKDNNQFITFFDYPESNLKGLNQTIQYYRSVIQKKEMKNGKPKYFSAAFTPDFSVVDAVSLSMSIPFLFRPYVIESEVNLDSNLPADYNKDYLGLYVDGGMLNNYPLHAFDYRPAKSINYQGDFANYFLASPNISLSATEFCDCILGIRLQNSVKEYEVSDDFKEGNSFIIRDFIGQLYSTILYPSEDGQIRSSLENNLSISIDVTDLELLDFSNPLINRKYRKLNALAEKQEKVIENAYKKIYENVQ